MCADLSACSAILSLLEVFSEHGVPSNIHSDRDRNFVSKEFDTFCKDLGIFLNFSSGYHHSANQVEHAVRTVKDLMKRCDSAGEHWRIALLKFHCTPGPDGVSPSDLMGRQFCGILPMIEKVANIKYSDKFSDRKDKEKEKFNTKHSRELKPLLVGSIVSYVNSDLVLVLSFHVHLITGTIISKLRVIKSFLIIGYISVKLMLNWFLRCRIF